MNLKVFDLFKFLYKWKIRIVIVMILSVALAGMYVDRRQTYNAQTVIKFNDSSVSEGKFPDASEFNVYDIASPKVIQRAINDLGTKRSVDSIRAQISIAPIIPASVEAIKKAKEKDGNSYDYHPNTYTVTYIGSGGQSAGSVRNILDAIILNYMQYYSEKYAELATVNNVVADSDIYNYDYFERVEIMNNNLESIIVSLEGYSSANDSFRSTTTGMSFPDLISEYNHLKNFTIPKIYADIYKGKVAINKDRLIEKYLDKEREMKLQKKNFDDLAKMTKIRMESFSVANKNVPNAYNKPNSGQNDDNLATIGDVYNYTLTNTQTKTTYDKLMESYTNQLIGSNNSKLSAEYYHSVVEKFEENTEKGVDAAALEYEVISMTKATIDKMNKLYDVTKHTIMDYNNIVAARNISLLTGVNCYETESKSLYVLVALVLSAGFMVVLAITIEIIIAYKKAVDEEKEEKSDEDDTDKTDGNDESEETEEEKETDESEEELKE